MKIEEFFYPAEDVFRNKPKSLNAEDLDLFSQEFNKKLTSIRSKTYNNTLVFSNGFCFIDGVYFKPQNIKHKIKVYVKTLILMLKIRKKKFLENAVLLTDINSSNFFHWFGDVLQKIEALKFSGVNLNDLNFLIPHPLNADLVIATTRSYNIPFIFIRENEIFYVKNLVVVPEIAPTGNYRSQLMRNIREPYIKGGFKNESKRIYITRSKALKRKIINEAELIPLLKKYDFNIISMEDLTFEEQFKLVIGAEVLVSLHGAGLTHMLWLATDAKVMEIRLKGDGVNNCYFSLASDLKINYYYCLADKVDKNAPTQLTDFYISPCEFQKSLDKLFRDG